MSDEYKEIYKSSGHGPLASPKNLMKRLAYSTNFNAYIAKNPNYGEERKPYQKPTEEEWERIKELLGTRITRGYGSIHDYEHLVEVSKKVYDNAEEPKHIRKEVTVYTEDDKQRIEQREDFIKWDVPY